MNFVIEKKKTNNNNSLVLTIKVAKGIGGI